MKLEAILIPSSSPLDPGAPYPVYAAASKAHSLIDKTDRTQLPNTVKSLCTTDGAFATTLIENLNIDPDKLIETVISICKLNDAFNAQLLEALLLPTANATGPPADSIRASGSKRKALDDVDLNTIDSGTSKKLKPTSPKPTYAQCTRCGDVFGSEENNDEACTYHLGELEVDDERYDWPDHDEDCHGPTDSYELKCESPQHYTWDCCDEGGDAMGCETRCHRAKGRKSEHAKLLYMGFKKWTL